MSKREQDIQTALEVLQTARKFDRHAAVAGGFPRDLYFNREYKDVDVYVRAVNTYNTSDYEHMVKNMFPDLEEFDTSGSMHHWKECGINWIDYTCRFYLNDLEVNIIFIKGFNPMGICQYFDFDICQFYLDNEGNPKRVAYSDFSDKKVKRISTIKGKQLEFSITDHYPRLKDKYPEFDFGETEEQFMRMSSKLGALL